MKFGVREICDVVFKAKSAGQLGKYSYDIGQPVLYIDSAKTSTMEGSATTVYATGGKGNNRLIAWEGEKTLTFTVEDALLSPMGLSILAGAGLLDATDKHVVHVHSTAITTMKVQSNTAGKYIIDLTDKLEGLGEIDSSAPVFVMLVDADNTITGDFVQGFTLETGNKKLSATNATLKSGKALENKNYNVFVDFYVEKKEGVQEIVIEEGTFGGNFYVEASTLFRRQSDGADLAAELVFPNVKIQSNFSFSMSSTGDPSTFNFTMDAFPGKTLFDHTKKVLCAIQIVDETVVQDAVRNVDDSLITTNDHVTGI